jgi:hypothetical protein
MEGLAGPPQAWRRLPELLVLMMCQQLKEAGRAVAAAVVMGRAAADPGPADQAAATGSDCFQLRGTMQVVVGMRTRWKRWMRLCCWRHCRTSSPDNGKTGSSRTATGRPLAAANLSSGAQSQRARVMEVD